MSVKRGSYIEMVVPLQCGHVLISRVLLSGVSKNWIPKTFEIGRAHV